MKTFNTDYKINFVDDNNVLVGWGNSQSCCESFGHFISRVQPTLVPNYDKNLPKEETIDTEGFNFDTKYFKEIDEEGYDAVKMVSFRLTKGDEEIFLNLHNSHNGYYSHGFEMEVGGTKIQDGCI